jgi:Autographiviridae portal protein
MAYTEGHMDTMRGSYRPDLSEAEMPGRACARYAAMIQGREPFLMRARKCSELTIPYLIPPEGWTGHSDLYTPFQGVGAKGVNHLTSKLMLSLFPVNSPFARLKIDGKAEDEAKKADPKLKDEVEAELADIERKMASEVETQQYRPRLAEGIKHAIVGGNTLFHFPEAKDVETRESVRVFRLDKFVVKRDPSGNLLEICVKEQVSPRSLSQSILDLIKDKVSYKGDDKSCDLYTYVYLEDGMFHEFQEIYGEIVPGSEGSYPADKLPWIPLRWHTIDGEDYGRGYVEDLLGDLQSVEGLQQAIVEGSAAAAKVLFLVNPNGSTKSEDIETAPNGAIRYGNAEDVSVLRVEKQNDFQIAATAGDKIEKRLAQGFLLNSSAQRQGERVTAEEWRFMITELEESLGGIYSIMSHSLQLPLIRLIMHRMTAAGKIPALKKGTFKPVIVTGLEALGRGQDLQKLREVVGDGIKTWGPEITAKYIHVDQYFKRLSTGAGIDPTGLIKTQDELKLQAEQEAQAAQTQQVMDMINKLGPAGIKAGVDMKGIANGAGSEADSEGAVPQPGA